MEKVEDSSSSWSTNNNIMSQLNIHFKHPQAQETFEKFLDGPITEFEDCSSIDGRIIAINADDLDIYKLQDTVIMELEICELQQGIDYDIFI